MTSQENMTTDPLALSPVHRVAVTGANGLIGRWLVLGLTRQGTRVLALMRRPDERLAELRTWIAARGGDATLVYGAHLDLDAPGLGLELAAREALRQVDAVYHLAARFGFGLSVAEARRANVEAPLELVDLLASADLVPRLVHISGYRTEGREARNLDVADAHALARFYRTHGAYEASKMEAHVRVARRAARQGVPLTRVSPAMVIGDSRTGETIQYTGLAETLGMLWRRRLPALVGRHDTWLPAVTVDFLADLLVRVPADPALVGEHLVVLDPATPTLPELVGLAADRMGRPRPRLQLPVGLVRQIPSWASGVDSESLSFISSDRYDTQLLARFMARHSLSMPSFAASFSRWVDHLLASRFGDHAPRAGRIRRHGGRRVFARGEVAEAEAVYLHGVMLHEGSWAPVMDRTGHRGYAPDLPGTGRSEGADSPHEWLRSVLAEARVPQVLVAHSLGTAFATTFAAWHPERVAELILVSPFFLQARPGWALRQPELVGAAFRFGPKRLLAAAMEADRDTTLIGDARDEAIDLLRDSAAGHARWLSWATRRDIRALLARDLELAIAAGVPVTLVVGSDDPLRAAAPAGARVVEVAGAGHYPQLTHPAVVAETVERAVNRGRELPRAHGGTRYAPPLRRPLAEAAKRARSLALPTVDVPIVAPRAPFATSAPRARMLA